MSDGRYYAEGEKPVGPISRAALLTILSNVSSAKDVLVWRAGFEHWQPVEDIEELTPSVPKPPPVVAHQTTALSPLVTRPEGRKKSTTVGRIIGFFCFSIVLSIIRQGANWGNDEAIGLTGNVRNEFVVAAENTCIKTQKASPANNGLDISVLQNYCKCYTNGLADKLSKNRLKKISTLAPDDIIKNLEHEIAASGDACQQSILTGMQEAQ